jgi:hypothetical protein
MSRVLRYRRAHKPGGSGHNRFWYGLQQGIEIYAAAHNQKYIDVLDEMNDQLGYGRKSMTIQRWLQENTIPSSSEIEYFAKKITSGTELDYGWIQTLFLAAGYEVPANFADSKIKIPNYFTESAEMKLRNRFDLNHRKSDSTSVSAFHARLADIFISYARLDVVVVQEIYKVLLRQKYIPWMDIHSIRGGDNWLRAIFKAIDECEIFLAVLSNNSVSRRGVIQRELKKALDKWDGMLPDDIYIIPLRIDDCPIPELLKGFQVIDWNNGKGKKKLLDAISIGIAKWMNSKA